MGYSKMCVKTERWKPDPWQADTLDVVKEMEQQGSRWCRCRVRTGARRGARPDGFQSGTSRPSLAAGSRPPWSPALPLTPSFTRAAWRWRAGGLHSDTRIHTQTRRHTHREASPKFSFEGPWWWRRERTSWTSQDPGSSIGSLARSTANPGWNEKQTNSLRLLVSVVVF